MSKQEAYKGLCSDCPKAATCTYPRDPARPVTNCCEHQGYEECEGSVSLSLVHSGYMLTRVKASEDIRPAEMSAPSTEKGLCVYCANRYACTYPKPVGGVWHCNEYL